MFFDIILVFARFTFLLLFNFLFLCRRECERLKHEVGIWKTVFQANKANLPSDVADNIEDEQAATEKTTDDEVSGKMCNFIGQK